MARPSGSRSDGAEAPSHRVMVIEDNPDTALLIEHALSGPDTTVEIVTFSDGEHALASLHGIGGSKPEAPLPSLILLDLNLPRLDGTEVLERLRAQPRTRLTPVVVFSSSDEPSDLAACYKRGANSYVRKPVDFDRFSEILVEVARYWLSVNHLAYDPHDPAAIEAPASRREQTRGP